MAYIDIMPLYQVIVLALVQGFTEFLPISSSAHLALAPWLLGWKDPGLTFDIALHTGTLLAILIYFYKDWLQILAQGFGLQMGDDPQLKANKHLLWLIAIATIPAAIAGLLLHKAADTTFRNPPLGPFIIGGCLIVFGLLMWWADRAGRKDKEIGKLGLLDALTIGIGQALAVIPGVSRSGVTITAGLARGYDR
jgi:undecaprenyl-diphosphatase